MKKTNKMHIENKKEKFAANEIFLKLNRCFTSTLKLTMALALFFIAALFISGAGIIAENGALNVSNSLLVNTNTLFVDSANNRVGIGTATPGRHLEVESTVSGEYPLRVDGVQGTIELQNSGGTQGLISTSASYFNTGGLADGLLLRSEGNGIQFAPGGSGSTVAVTMLPSGNVGIGTTSPGRMLDVSGQTRSRGYFEHSESDGTRNWLATIHKAITGSGTDRSMVLFTEGTGAGSDIYFMTNGTVTTRMIIKESGNVGIGTTSPSQKLTVSGNANITGTVYYGALQANSPVLERTAEPFVARCTIADDGKLVVEYIHAEAGTYSKVIEAVDSDGTSWWHRNCFEKSEKFKFLDTLSNKSITIDDIGFDWGTKTAFVK